MLGLTWEEFNACSLFAFTVSPQKFKLSSNRFQARLVITTELFTWNCLSMLVYQINVLKISPNIREILLMHTCCTQRLSSVISWNILLVTCISRLINTRTNYSGHHNQCTAHDGKFGCCIVEETAEYPATSKVLP